MKIRCALLLAAALLLPAGPVVLGGGKKEVEAKKEVDLKGKGDKSPPAAADPGEKAVKVAPAPAEPGTVEVRFTNGSIVVMTLLQDKIEIVTEYGKLIVPPRDIKAIEFGVHTTPEEAKKLDDAIVQLGSSAHAERDAAVNELIRMGPLAYQRVIKAATSKDPEVSRRAEAALKTIREKYPAKILRNREEDVVRTHKFSIVGRITTPTLRAKADDFGELDLRPGRLLAMRALAGDTQKIVTVDAALYGVPGNNKWLATGIKLEASVGVKITASGQVDLLPQQPGQRLCGPDGGGGNMPFVGGGMGGKGMRFFNPGGQMGGELMGRIGTGPIFYIGSRHTFTPKTAGELFLMIQQSPWGCPSNGEYRVALSTGPLMEDEADD
jgi:hypothetical protein